MVIRLRRILLGALAVSSALAIGLGGTAQAHVDRHHRHHHPQATSIPQHNGGDHDADNNGGPSDGDGAL